MSTIATPRRTRPARVVATLAVIAILGGAVLVSQTVRSSTTSDETFTLAPGSSRLDVDVDRGQVLLKVGTGDRVQVRRTVSGGRRASAIEERADAHGASLKSRCPALSTRGCSVSYEIAVPAYVIDVVAGTAGVQVHGLTVDKLQVDVSSGSTLLEDIEGPVEINSGSGSITRTGLGLQHFVARAGSGRTSLDFDWPPKRVSRPGSVEQSRSDFRPAADLIGSWPTVQQVKRTFRWRSIPPRPARSTCRLAAATSPWCRTDSSISSAPTTPRKDPK